MNTIRFIAFLYLCNFTSSFAQTPSSTEEIYYHKYGITKVEIRSNVYEDKVFLDGALVGSTPIILDLPKRKIKYQLRIEKNGFIPAKISLSGDNAVPDKIAIHLNQTPNEGSSLIEGVSISQEMKNVVTISTQALEDMVYLDGVYLGRTRLSPSIPGGTGEHELRIESRQYHPTTIILNSEYLPSYIRIDLKEKWWNRGVDESSYHEIKSLINIDETDIEVRSNVNNAVVSLNGNTLGTDPLYFPLSKKVGKYLVGAHTIGVEKELYLPARFDLVKEEGLPTPSVIRVFLKKDPVHKDSEQYINPRKVISTLRLRTQLYDDRVYYNGAFIGSTELEIDINHGIKKHILRIESDSHYPVTISLIPDFLPSQINFDLRRRQVGKPPVVFKEGYSHPRFIGNIFGYDLWEAKFMHGSSSYLATISGGGKGGGGLILEIVSIEKMSKICSYPLNLVDNIYWYQYLNGEFTIISSNEIIIQGRVFDIHLCKFITTLKPKENDNRPVDNSKYQDTLFSDGNYVVTEDNGENTVIIRVVDLKNPSDVFSFSIPNVRVDDGYIDVDTKILFLAVYSGYHDDDSYKETLLKYSLTSGELLDSYELTDLIGTDILLAKNVLLSIRDRNNYADIFIWDMNSLQLLSKISVEIDQGTIRHYLVSDDGRILAIRLNSGNVTEFWDLGMISPKKDRSYK